MSCLLPVPWICNFWHSLRSYTVLQDFLTCSLRSLCLPAQPDVAVTMAVATASAAEEQGWIWVYLVYSVVLSVPSRNSPLFTLFVLQLSWHYCKMEQLWLYSWKGIFGIGRAWRWLKAIFSSLVLFFVKCSLFGQQFWVGVILTDSSPPM